MTDNLDEAKKLFFDYSCRTFFMQNDGVLKKYESFGVSYLQEIEWRQEYVAYWLGRLSVDDLTAVNKLQDADAGEALPELIEKAGQGDAYAQLWYANAIWNIADRTSPGQTLKNRAKTKAEIIWKALVQEPIEISPEHQKGIYPFLRPLKASNPVEYVVNYARRMLSESKGKH